MMMDGDSNNGKLARLIDIFPNWYLTGAIFTQLSKVPNYTPPWGDDESYLLDIEYIGNRSGYKYVSPLLSKVTSDLQESLPKIAGMIVSVYGEKWEKLKATLEFEYNPIENYSMVETGENDITTYEYGKTVTRTDSLIHAHSGSDTQIPDTLLTQTDNLKESHKGSDETAPNIVETMTPDVTVNSNNSQYGFNSSTAVPVAEQMNKTTGSTSQSRTGTETITYDSSRENTGTQTIQNSGNTKMEYDSSFKDSGTQTFADGGKDIHTRDYTLKRSGNIGVTTSQQMIQSERDLWMWNLYTTIFQDLDAVLTLPIY